LLFTLRSQAIFRDILTLYNESHVPPLNMVLFDFALDHVTRVHRVLRIPQGHCLCIGVGGSGKATLIRLAAFTAECEVFEIMLVRGYNEATFREDLKVISLSLSTLGRRRVVAPSMLTDPSQYSKH